MTTIPELERGIRALRAGNRREARRILGQVVREQPDSAKAWWYLSLALDDIEQKVDCLEHVVRLHPEHDEARRMLKALEGRVARPTPTSGIERPVITAKEGDDGALAVPTQYEPRAPVPPEPDTAPPEAPTPRSRDLFVAGVALLFALVAIIGTVVIVATGRGEQFGVSPPGSTPTPQPVNFERPACSQNVGDDQTATLVFVNNTPLTLEILRGPLGREELLITLEPNGQGRVETQPSTQVRYSIAPEDPGYAGGGASIDVPAGSTCRVPIVEGP